MACWNCAPELCCTACHRPVFSVEPPDFPGRLCSECWYKKPHDEAWMKATEDLGKPPVEELVTSDSS